jgi:hypothetical protein
MIYAELADGRKLEFPDGTDPSVVQSTVKKVLGVNTSNAPDQPTALQPAGGALQTAGNVAAGMVRGAGSIGATIIAPYDIGKDLVAGKGLSLESNRQRRADMTAALESMGAEPDSAGFQTGKIGAEIAGTLPIGGILSSGAKALGAPAAVSNAIASGGLKLGTPAATTAFGRAVDWLTRIGSGAIVGGAQAGLVNPEDASTGAAIGGALPPAVKAFGAAGDYLKKGSGWAITNAIGASTGTSAETVAAAFNAGKKGATEFLNNMRGKVDFGDVVDSAKKGLVNMRQARAEAYRNGMIDIKQDASVLSFTGIDDALNNVVSTGSFKGVPIRKKAAETVSDLDEVVSTWRDLDPAAYHTPEGFDALKQAIGDIRDSTQFGTPARRAADNVYHAVKAEINKQAPVYAEVMKDYQSASNSIKEIEKALSLGEKASEDTAIRKLQSLMRNNAQSNYGNRLSLAKTLEEGGGVSLEPAIAGQAMNSALPRGMVGALEKAVVAPGAAAAVATGALSPYSLLAAPFTSPRLMGESAYGVGSLLRAGNQAASAVNPLLRYAPSNAGNILLRSAPIVAGSQLIQR